MVRAELSTRTGGIRQWKWISVGGGDGFQNQIDPTDYNIFYTESQNAGIKRYNLTTGETTSIKPRLGGGGRGGGGGAAGGRAGGPGPAGAPAGAGGARGAAATTTPPGATAEAPTAEAPPAPPQAGFGGGGGRATSSILRRRDHAVQLELADPPLAAQPEHDLPRRASAVHLARPRRRPG